MKRKYTLKKNEDFQFMIGNCKKKVSPEFIIYYRPNGAKISQFGLSVSKKMANAVNRNYIRRQLRAMLDNFAKFDLGMDFIIIVRNKYTENNYEINLEKLKSQYFSIVKDFRP